ncbi:MULTISPECIES: TetR/AcrR family transcriptional regulator [Cohnella]|uniref:TetR/AcrR family transcriptional regulator n=1 Tax=Cohnella TaxID=329857 RepID=UPI0009BA5B47|nr:MULTISPECIES: TetR/AcrR family transcriptional regulator [Cohnella]MBN2980327.1 TetR/AcrR family transcriptional regulator [Cohnella algarum]
MSPRTKEQNEEIRSARVKQMIAAAAEVYLEKGMAFEMRDVAFKAGVGYGTAYHYYSNKHRLVRDMLDQALERAAALTAESMRTEAPPRQRLNDLGKRLARLWSADPACLILYRMASEKFHQLPPEDAASLGKAFQTGLFEPIERALLEESGPKEAERSANVWLGALVGCANLWLYHDRSRIGEPDWIELLYEGLKRKEKQL